MSVDNHHQITAAKSSDEIALSALLCQDDSKHNQTASKTSWVGLALVGLTGGAAIVLSVIAAPFVAPALRKICLPYVPATTAQVNNVMKALKSRKTCPSTFLVDLGSGDGRIVIAASQQFQVRGIGVELNPWLVYYSRLSALRHGVFQTTKFMTKDLWKLHLKPYDSVVIFGVDEMMEPLEHKIAREILPPSCVVACRFPLPNHIATKTFGSGLDTVWLYEDLANSKKNESTDQQRL